MQVHDVFILTAEHRDLESGHELHFFGRSEELGPVLLIFTETQPVFFIDKEERLPNLGFEIERKPLKLTSFKDRPVDGIYFKSDEDRRNAADRFKATGVRQFEADIRPGERFLMERFIKTMARIGGEYEQKGKLAVFTNPKIKASQAPIPPLSLVSLDIECGVTEEKLYSIGLHYKDQEKEDRHVFMVSNEARKVNSELTYCISQKACLEAFYAWMKEWDPDLIIGWHVIGFDLMYLERRARELSLNLDIARSENGKVTLIDRPGAGAYADISGRVVIDGIPAMRGCGFTFPNYKLETVAQTILQTGKLIASDHNKVSEIERQFREDKEALARYNLEDCVLVTEIYERVNLVPLMLERARTSGMLLDRLAIPAGALDHFLLPKLHRKGIVAPMPKAEAAPIELPQDAASAPRPGAYESVAVLDFINVIPSLVRVFKIGPYSLARRDIETQTMPTGQRFSGKEYILPELFAEIMEYQNHARAKDNAIAVKGADLTMKQICKSLAHKSCRFREPELLFALDAAEKWLITQAIEQLNSTGYDVLMADSESLFIQLKESNQPGDGEFIAKNLNSHFKKTLTAEFGISTIEVAYRSHLEKLVIPPNKIKENAIMKSFAAIEKKGSQRNLLLEGMEASLNDWTELARNFCDGMFDTFFNSDEDIEKWMQTQMDELKEGKQDDTLVYRKKIRKPVHEYGKNPPVHIRAARLLDKPGREVRYVFTTRGPEPVDISPTGLDYDHYINKQLDPIASWILGPREKELAKLEEPEQMGLF